MLSFGRMHSALVARIVKRIGIFLVFGLTALEATPVACASWTALPESYHQLYDAWGVFLDEQTLVTFNGSAQLWSGVGGALAVVGDEQSVYHPEIILHASANASMHFNDNWRLWTETVDARLGAAFEMAVTPQFRFSVGLTHFSGHTSDGINTADSYLMDTTVGQEFIPIRFIYEIDNRIRMGSTLSSALRSSPAVQFLWLEEFFEYFPWGGRDSRSHFSPYVSLSFSQTGINNYLLTGHIQIGAYLGNHFSLAHRQTLRAVLGFYSGADLRIKYYDLLQSTVTFAYLGLMFDI